MSHENDMMNVFDAADYLGVHVQTLRRLARQKKIPAFKVGRDWRFRKEALIRWSDEQEHHHEEKRDAFFVLIVDDEEVVCRGMASLLRKLGCRVRCSTSGLAGLEQIAIDIPDLVFLDLKMSTMKGPQFLKRLREEHPTLSVVIVTSHPEGELFNEMMQYPPLGLLPKPATREQLENTLLAYTGAPVRALQGCRHES